MSLVMNYMTDDKLPKALLDSNILIYLKDKDSPKKQEVSQELLIKAAEEPQRFAICNQNLSEFARVTIEKMDIPIKHIRELIDTIISSENFIILDSWHVNDLSFALDMQQKFKLHFWDAKLVATMISNRIGTIYTENTKDFEKIPGITAINPFK